MLLTAANETITILAPVHLGCSRPLVPRQAAIIKSKRKFQFKEGYADAIEANVRHGNSPDFASEYGI
jgi:hypothetical protein